MSSQDYVIITFLTDMQEAYKEGNATEGTQSNVDDLIEKHFEEDVRTETRGFFFCLFCTHILVMNLVLYKFFESDHVRIMSKSLEEIWRSSDLFMESV